MTSTTNATPSRDCLHPRGLQIVPITREHFAEWKQMRQALYSGLDDAYHDAEMEAIVASQEMRAFLAIRPPAAVIGLLELSLCNVVDGCLGPAVGAGEPPAR